MSTVFKEYQGASGLWYINCPSKIGKVENQWWYPARGLSMPLTDFVLLLVNTYKAQISWNGKYLNYYWQEKDYPYCHKFLLFLNKSHI